MSLFYAAYTNNAEEALQLIEDGEDVNGEHSQNRNSPFRVPLLAALRSHHWHMMELLLTAGADTELPTARLERTVLFRLIKTKNLSMVRRLIHYGANVSAADLSGKTPLQMAVKNGLPEITEALVQAGADINAINEEGGSALLYA
ncbi:ankyrin repeat-containing domain protein, partial [Baffinella frigidus]